MNGGFIMGEEPACYAGVLGWETHGGKKCCFSIIAGRKGKGVGRGHSGEAGRGQAYILG